MNEKGLYYPVVRRLITIVLLLLITGGFLAVYYLVYLPQQHASYNLRTFRILHEIAGNFRDRVQNYGIVSSYNYVTKHNRDIALYGINLPVSVNKKDSTADTSKQKRFSADFKSVFNASFKGDVANNDLFSTSTTILQDSVHYKSFIKASGEDKITITKLDTTVPLRIIFEPVVTIHYDVFESVLLIKQTDGKGKHYDSILYESDKLDIANINTDSLFKNKNIEAPAISDLNIENNGYKLYLLPFKLPSNPDETFVLGGIISYDNYHDQSQGIPVYLLLSVALLLVVLLLALPFLKIFYLSSEETININDVRAVITVIFIIPFFATLIAAGIWLSVYSSKSSTEVLSMLQNNVQKNFYSEISSSIQQAKRYDSIVTDPEKYVDTGISLHTKMVYDSCKNSIDFKDIIFYPEYYKNFTSLHWMNTNGYDVAAWNFNKSLATYFNVNDRQYFRDIKFSRLNSLSDSQHYAKDSFSLQPVLSRLTGEYTINMAIKSKATFTPDRKAIAVGLSSKMYSVYNTIVPNGYVFCIINAQGDIVCHSDTARNLQENIFEECSNNSVLRSIINHKDSVLIPDIGLYDESVKMIIKPLPGMPYYLITYYNKRAEYLFLFHILAFVFVSEATLLLFVSLFSYFMMLGDKKNSKLFFATSTLTWLRPSPDKKNYYIKNSIQFIASVCFIWLVSRFF